MEFSKNNRQSLVVCEKIDSHVFLKLKNEKSLMDLCASKEFSEYMELKSRTKSKKPKSSYIYRMKDVISDMERAEWSKGLDFWEREVVYHRSKKMEDAGLNYGRFYSGCSAQSMKKMIRDMLFHFCSTLDICNSYFVIAREILKRDNKSFTLLDEYCKDRVSFFSRFEEAIDKKKLLISLLFGASLKKWREENGFEITSTMTQFSEEMAKIRSHFWETHQWIERDEKASLFDMEVTNLSTVLQTVESLVVVECISFFKSRGNETRLIVHDAIEIEGRLEENTELLDELREYIKEKLEIDILFQWKEKDVLNLENVPESEDTSYAGMKMRFEENNFKVIMQNVYYSKIQGIYVISDQKQMVQRWKHLQYDGFDGKRPTFIDDWILDDKIRVYIQAGLYPDGSICPPNTFNMFTGFEVDKLSYANPILMQTIDEPEVKEGVDTVKWLFRRLVENDEHYVYLMIWIASIFRHPDTKPRVAIVIKSAQGCGKGLAGKFICDLIGNQYTFKTPNIENVVGQFNAGIHNKFLVILDDVCTLKSETIERFKSPISEPTITIRRMHTTAFETRDFVRYLMFTNSDRFLTLTEEERRFFLTCSNSLKLTSIETQKVLRAIEDVRVQKKFHEYLMELPIDNGRFFAFDDKRPLSSLYSRVKEFYQSLEMQFLCDFILTNCLRETPPMFTNSKALKEFFIKLEVSQSALIHYFSKWTESNKYQFSGSTRDFTFRLESEFKGNLALYGITRCRKQSNGRDRKMWSFSDIRKVLFFMTERDVLEKGRYEEILREWGRHEVSYTKEVEVAD